MPTSGAGPWPERLRRFRAAVRDALVARQAAEDAALEAYVRADQRAVAERAAALSAADLAFRNATADPAPDGAARHAAAHHAHREAAHVATRDHAAALTRYTREAAAAVRDAEETYIAAVLAARLASRPGAPEPAPRQGS